MTTVAERLVQTLSAAGVERIFGLVGDSGRARLGKAGLASQADTPAVGGGHPQQPGER